MIESYEVKPGVFVLPSSFPLGEMGTLPVNAYLVKGRSSYLVDTGMMFEPDAFIAEVESLIDPEDLRLIVLTHADPDHIGALHALLSRAPDARLVTNFVSSAKLQVMGRPVSPSRLYMVNAGEPLELAGRRFIVTKPATFDAPETLAFFDRDLDVLFSSDSFGAPLSTIPAIANDIAADELTEKEALWATLDAPWIHNIDRARFAALLDEFARANPEWILSSHLPPAHRMMRTLVANVSKAPDSIPVHLPTQIEFEAMMAAAGSVTSAGDGSPAPDRSSGQLEQPPA